MAEQQTLRRRTRGLGFALVVMSLVAYFGYFAVYGKHGLVTWLYLEQQIAEEQTKLAQLRLERATLEHRVRLMRPESVDPDMLDEQARARLGFAAPDEVVILRDKR